jgi:hypothetical protein
MKLSFKNEGEIKTFSDNQLHREFVASRYVLHKMLWGVLQAQIKG